MTKPVFAQETSQTEERTFAQFGNDPLLLKGPVDDSPLKFNLPAHWQLTGDVLLRLQMTVFIPSTGTETFDGTFAVLKLNLNGKTVGEIPIQENGDINASLLLPLTEIPDSHDIRMQLALESYLPPKPDQPDVEARIHPRSTFQFTYAAVTPSTDLIRFPNQFIQDSLEPDRALLVVPDQPTIMELQSALTVAVGLGHLSNNRLSLELIAVSQVTPEMQAGNHLILVGKPEPFLALKGMIFPSPIVVRSDPSWTVQFLAPDRYEFERTAPDDGVAQLINSPWNARRFVLLVSGETDAGVLKAAQAVGSGKLRTNVFPNLAIVKETRIESDTSASESDAGTDSPNDNSAFPLSLTDYHVPFVSDPTLSSTAFVLPREDASAWGEAIRLAGRLGAAANGTIFNPSAFYGDELPTEAFSGYNLFAIGRASTLPFIAELGDALPVPFEKGKDIPAETGLDITYRISKDYDSAGYLEIFPSPLNDDHAILAVFGTDPQGLAWSVSALSDPALRERLSGNFALVNDTQLFVRDTRPSSTESSNPAPTPEPASLVVTQQAPLIPQEENSSLIWQAGIALLILSVLVVIVLLQRKMRNH